MKPEPDDLDMPWRLRPAGLADTGVYAVPDGQSSTTVLGWIQQTPHGWRRYPPDTAAVAFPHPEQAILDLIEYLEHAGEQPASD